MKLMIHITMALVLLVIGCATKKVETAEDGWKRAMRINTVRSYKNYLEKHPNSEFESMAKQKLQEARFERQKTIEIYNDRAKEIEISGGKTWPLTFSNGEKVILSEGMSIDQVEEALGFSIVAMKGLFKGAEKTIKSHIGVTFKFNGSEKLVDVLPN